MATSAAGDDQTAAPAPRRFAKVRVGSGRPRRWHRLFGLTALAAPLVYAVASAFPTHPAPPPGGGYFVPLPSFGWFSTLTTAVWLVGLGALAAYGLARLWLPRPHRPASVAALSDSVEIHFEDGTTRRIPHESIEHVALRPVPTPAPTPAPTRQILMRLRGGQLVMLDAGEATDRLLEAITPEPREFAARLPVRAVANSHPLGCFAWGGALVALVGLLGSVHSVAEQVMAGLSLSSATAFASAAVWAVAAVVAARLLNRRQVVVGNDGIRIDGALRRKFVPFDQIARIEQTKAGRVVVHLQDGGSVKLAEVKSGPGLAARIRLALAQRGRTAPVAGTEQLRRRGRTSQEWAGALTQGEGEGSYRATGLRFEDLGALVADPAVSPELRVAAGVALSGDEQGRRRVALAADACADRDMQAALEAAAEGEISERALTRVQRRRAPD